MSFGDVVIGEGDYGNCAFYEVRSKNVNLTHLTQNVKAFWCKPSFFEHTNMIILRNSEEGKILNKMLDEQNSETQNFIDSLYLKHIDIKIFNKLFDQKITITFNKGKDAKIKEIMEVMTIGGY